MVCRPNRVAAVHEIVSQELQRHTNIDIHCGKTKIWNRRGEKSSGVDQLTMAARVQDPGAIVWRGDHEIPVSEQGMKVLGAPKGRDEYTTRFLEKKSEKHDILFQRIPMVPDVQASWLLLSFSVPPHGPTFTCETQAQKWHVRSPSPTTLRCTTVCARSLVWIQMMSAGVLSNNPRSRSTSEYWGWQVQ